jgi:hypothetical protein
MVLRGRNRLYLIDGVGGARDWEPLQPKWRTTLNNRAVVIFFCAVLPLPRLNGAFEAAHFGLEMMNAPNWDPDRGWRVKEDWRHAEQLLET